MSDKLSLKLTIEPLTEERMRALIKAVEDAATPAGGYEPGDGSMDGAQIVNGEWWHPVMGCDSLETTLEAIQNRLAFAIGVWYAGTLHSKQEEA